MYYKWLFLLIIIIVFTNRIKENFDNCFDCNECYNNRLQDIQKKNKRQLLGYNPNDYIYKIFLMDSEEPLPVNANFWINKY